MFGSKTPITKVPAGYKPDLDRLPPREGGGCRGLIVLLVGLTIGFLLVIGFIISLVQERSDNASALPTLIPTETITNTPFPTQPPTVDYCWFLTPSPIPTQTAIPITPDEWALQGTQIALQTGTPIPTPQPTQQPPKAWCNHITPTDLPTIPPTDTPIVPSATITNTPLFGDAPTLFPTSTLFPTLVPRVDNRPVATGVPRIEYETIVVTQPPVLVVETQLVVSTQVVIQTQVTVQVVTATPTPSPTTIEVTAEVTPEVTLETATATNTATHTPTATFTATATNTAISPTPSYTHTQTPTQTPTNAPTATNTAIPTDAPEVTDEP